MSFLPSSVNKKNIFPLRTASKGFWSEMLGVGDFYYELGVQIVEVCMATSKKNGGELFNNS